MIVASLARTELGWLVFGYGGALGAVGIYAWRVVARGRRLARDISDDEKPWL